MLGMRTCLPCHIPDRWSRNANRIWPDLAFGFVHKRSGNEISYILETNTPFIISLFYKNDCFTGKYTTPKIQTKPHLVISCFSLTFLVYDRNVFEYSSKVFWNLRLSSENIWSSLDFFVKCAETFMLPTDNFRQIFGSLPIVFGNVRKIVKIVKKK